MLKKVVVLVLLTCAFLSGCGGQTPTAPDPPQAPQAGTPPQPPVQPPATPPTPTPPPPNIARTRFLAFGDSLTAGTTSPAVMSKLNAGLPQSYPFKLQSLLSARYTAQSIVVFNEGLPLEETVDAVRRLPRVLRDTLPEVVILLHGVNDITGPAVVSRTLGYLNTLARDARGAGASVLLCTLPPHRQAGSRAGDPGAIASYNVGIRDLARGEGAILVDLDRLVDLSLIGIDGLHPTEAGYERIAQIIFSIVQSQYERGPASPLLVTARRH